MTRVRLLALLVVAAHWMVAIWHLFVAAKVLPPQTTKLVGSP
ncbi:MAG: hypothetical protein WBQ81_15155 [Candidatus Sulfotelmatobacter sp.]